MVWITDTSPGSSESVLALSVSAAVDRASGTMCFLTVDSV